MLRVLHGVRSVSRAISGSLGTPGRVPHVEKFCSTRSTVHLRLASTVAKAEQLLRHGDFDPANLTSLSPVEAFRHTPTYYPEDLKAFFESIEYLGLESEFLEQVKSERDSSKRLGKLMAFLRNQIIQGHAVQETHLLEWFKKYVRIENGKIKPRYTKSDRLGNVDMSEMLNHVVNRTTKPSVEFLNWLAQDDPVLCEHHLLRSYLKDLLVSRGFVVERQGKIDVRYPEELFPDARMLTRKIICHLGPTNSGKTYRALERLKKAKSGYYAGPLRLLARETYDRIKDEGLAVNLKTGEEVIYCEDEFGRHAPLTAGTVEMIDTNQPMEVCVIDEIQMLNDKSRGWAWLNAVLGVQAKEVHLCGEESVVDMIKEIVAKTGDTLEINRYERLGTLEMEKRPLKSLRQVKAGDCVVAFSRKKVFEYRKEIEATSKLKCSIIYGALPPETRVTQSRAFNSGENEVLVATDAVGMGLNLSINRIVFASITKFDGQEELLLEPPQTKQIAGRAGRYKVPGSDKVGSVGYVTTMSKQMTEFVAESLKTPTRMLSTLYVKPPDDIVAPLATGVRGLAKLMARLPGLTELSKHYRLPDFDSQMSLSESCYPNLAPVIAFNISGVPVGNGDYCKTQVFAMTRAIAVGTVYTTAQLANPALQAFIQAYSPVDRLKIMEDLHRSISTYRWLENRYPQTFVDLEGVNRLRLLVEDVINDILRPKVQEKHKK